jgi:hypothetical protein
MSDKRAQFFAIAALVCLGLVPLADHQFRSICLGLAVTYVVLAAASWLDHRSRH